MPTITLYRGRHQLSAQAEFPSTANLEQSLNALASSNVAPPYTFRVYNLDRDQLNLTSGRCVGDQPLEAEVEILVSTPTPLQARVLSLEADVAKLKTDSAAIMAVHDAIKAANADLWAPRIRNLAAQLLLLACGRETLHFGDLAQLEQEVYEVQRNITPQLEALCRWECKFVRAYDFIKERFPTRF
jgi:hypothetical protein